MTTTMPAKPFAPPPAELPQLATFRNFVRALRAADLVNIVEGRGPVTVFAIPDSAFPATIGDSDTSIFADHAQLTQLLRRHIVKGRISFAELPVGRSVRVATISRQTLRLVNRGGTCFVNGVRAQYTDLPASNGIIHLVESVLPSLS